MEVRFAVDPRGDRNLRGLKSMNKCGAIKVAIIGLGRRGKKMIPVPQQATKPPLKPASADGAVVQGPI